ncbi:hypothetical protein F4825DRAFT_451668 [Nemania diffusa]|nr:hypothetical protein F4825DRAFT_451668 [Nemania diffusa]
MGDEVVEKKRNEWIKQMVESGDMATTANLILRRTRRLVKKPDGTGLQQIVWGRPDAATDQEPQYFHDGQTASQRIDRVISAFDALVIGRSLFNQSLAVYMLAQVEQCRERWEKELGPLADPQIFASQFESNTDQSDNTGSDKAEEKSEDDDDASNRPIKNTGNKKYKKRKPRVK